MATSPVLILGAYTPPAPASITPSYEDLDSEKTGRTEAGYLHRDTIRLNIRNFDLEFMGLTSAQVSTLLAAISVPTFSATILDPKNNTNSTGTFYAAKRQTRLLVGGTNKLYALTCTFIEC